MAQSYSDSPVTKSRLTLPMRLSMAHQIGGLVLLSLIVFGAISSLIVRTKYAESLRQDLITRGKSIAFSVSSNIQSNEGGHHPGEITDALGDFAQIYGVDYILVLDRSGSVIRHTFEGPVPSGLLESVRFNEGIQEIELESGRVFDIAASIVESGSSVHVGMDLDVIGHSLGNVPLIVWRILLVGVICATTVSVIVYLLLIRPIRHLTESVRQIGQGRFPGKTPIRSTGELGSLARSLEQMSADLERYHEELEAKTAECRVSKEELERQNEEIKQAQAHMIRSEKFASMGQIAASVAHEISNPLAGILTYVKLMRRKLEAGQGLQTNQENYRQYLLTMERETERCGHILKNLLDFARSSEPDLRGIDVHRVIEDTLFLLNFKLLMNDVVVEREWGDIPNISGDFGQLKQVFLNVILNAVEAMRGETRILRVQTSYHSESQTVLVRIQDTGEGISEGNIYKVFDPFFTTKPRGTGMGLAVVWAILDKHNADMNIDSESGKGTIVTIQLNIDQSQSAWPVSQEA